MKAQVFTEIQVNFSKGSLAKQKAINLNRIPKTMRKRIVFHAAKSQSPCIFNFLVIKNPTFPYRCNLLGLTIHYQD